MVRCWNCKHLFRAYSGKVADEKLFEKELRKCKVKSIILGYKEIQKRENATTLSTQSAGPKQEDPLASQRLEGILLI